MAVYGIFLVSGLGVGAIYALSGVGLVLLYRASGVLNLAYGAIGACGAMTAWQLAQWHLPEPIGWGVAIGLATLLSIGYGAVIAPMMAFREPVVKAVASLGLALVLLGLMNFLWPIIPRRLGLPTDMVGFSLLGVRITVTRAITFSAALVATLGIAAFLSLTRTGLLMRALANNRSLSSVLGVPIVRVETMAWGISGVMAGFSGLMLADLVRLDPVVLTFLVIPAVAAAILGGLVSMGATLAGGMLIGVVESMTTLVPHLAPFRPATPFVLATLAILWLRRNRTLLFAGHD